MKGFMREIDPLAWAVIVILLLTTTCMLCRVDAQFADLPHDEAFIDLGYSADKRDRQYDVTAVVPIWNGWLGTNVSQSMQDGELDAQTIILHAQNGWRIKELGNLGVEGFGDAEWNQVRGTDTKSFGGFIRPGILKYEAFTLSGGLGSMVENEAVRAELGLKDTDPVTLPRALGFVSLKWTVVPDKTTVTALLKGMPTFAFDEMKWTLAVTALHEITENVSLGQTFYFDKDTAPVIESAGENWQLRFAGRIQL